MDNHPVRQVLRRGRESREGNSILHEMSTNIILRGVCNGNIQSQRDKIDSHGSKFDLSAKYPLDSKSRLHTFKT